MRKTIFLFLCIFLVAAPGISAFAVETDDMDETMSYTIYEDQENVNAKPSRFSRNTAISPVNSRNSQARSSRPNVVGDSAIASFESDDSDAAFLYPISGGSEYGLLVEDYYYEDTTSVQSDPVFEEAYEMDAADINDNMFFDLENAEQLEAKRTPDEIVIKFKDPSEVRGFEKQLQREIDKVQKIGFVEALGVYVVNVDDLEKNPNAVLNRFKNNRFVEYVEPNYTMDFSLIPNDAEYSRLSTMLGWMNTTEGWSITEGKNSPIIAIIDSGVATHVDLPQLLGGYAAVAGLAYGNDQVGHGTSVAGVAGAVGNNKIGIAGMNWNAKILPVRIDTSTGSIAMANVAKGIVWATDSGAKVLNLSLGTSADNVTLKNAINYAYDKGCAIFAATGNESKSSLNYPARYSNVLGVGSTTNGTSRVASSNYGDGLDVVGVGAYYATTAAGGYAAVSGTSFASPQAAGLASLILAVNPNLKNDEVYDLIRQGAKPLGGGYNAETGYGLLDIGKTLKLASASSEPAPPAYTTPPTITLKSFTEVNLFVGDTYVEMGYTAVDCFNVDITAYVKVSGSINTGKAGIYTLSYTVTDDGGNTVKTTRTIIVTELPVVEPEVILPPTLTIIGSDPIILHQQSGTPYVEQGAKAVDTNGKDISGSVEIIGGVDRNKAGVYLITYRVTGKDGGEALADREVWILAPTSQKITRKPYGFSGQGKQGATITHSGVVASNSGWMDLNIGTIDKNMTITVQLVVASTREAVLTDSFSAAGSKQYKIGEGRYELAVTVSKSSGNSKYGINLLMPEVTETEFEDAEVTR